VWLLCVPPPVLAARPASEPTPYVLHVAAQGVELPIAMPLPESWEGDGSIAWQLVEEDHDLAIPAQLGAAPTADGSPSEARRRLLAIIPPGAERASPRRFHLIPAAELPPTRFDFSEISPESLKLREGDLPVLVYNHGLITRDDIPEHDHRRSRSCYIHPLYGLNGEPLTDDFPADHYHHHGVFWTWPHVMIDDQPHDLWAGSTIRQAFTRFLVQETGPVAAVLAVENGWHVGAEQVMTERIWMTAFRAAADDRSVDLQLFFTPLRTMTLQGAEEKSYGGLTVRFAPGPRPETVITVPSGPTGDDLPDTPLAWADFTSRFAPLEHQSGAAIFVPPHHPDYPPTWLTRYYGPLCVGWPGVQARQFPPDDPFHLDYRLWIHRHAAEFEQLQEVYAGYQQAVQIRWEVPEETEGK
jgi:hypothetical protein